MCYAGGSIGDKKLKGWSEWYEAMLLRREGMSQFERK